MTREAEPQQTHSAEYNRGWADGQSRALDATQPVIDKLTAELRAARSQPVASEGLREAAVALERVAVPPDALMVPAHGPANKELYDWWQDRFAPALRDLRTALASQPVASESVVSDGLRSRIDNLRKAIDGAVSDLNEAWGGFGPSEQLERAIGVLQRARTADDIAQGRDWPPVVIGTETGHMTTPDRADLREVPQQPRMTRTTAGGYGGGPDRADPERRAEGLDVERLREALCEAIWNNDPTDGYLADPAVVRLLVDAVLTDPNVKWALAAPEAE